MKWQGRWGKCLWEQGSNWKISEKKQDLTIKDIWEVCMSKKFGDLQSQHTIKLELQIKLLLLYMPCRGSEPCFVSQTQNKIETPKTPQPHWEVTQREEITFRRAFVPSELKILIRIWYTMISACWIAGRAGYWGVRICCWDLFVLSI